MLPPYVLLDSNNVQTIGHDIFGFQGHEIYFFYWKADNVPAFEPKDFRNTSCTIF